MRTNYDCNGLGNQRPVKFKKNLWLLSLLLIFIGNIKGTAQVSDYYFGTTTNGVLDAMTGSTQLIGSGSDDGAGALVPIGFNFSSGGVSYTNFSANANGVIRLGALSGAPGIYYINSEYYAGLGAPLIMPYWDDLSTGTNGKVHCVLTGTAPNRILKVEWIVTVPHTYTGAAGGKFQCWLYETSNVIEFIYGSGMVENPTSSNLGYTIGISASSADYRTVDVPSHTSSKTNFKTNNTTPITSGRTYRFMPAVFVSSLPYTVSAQTTCGAWNNVTATNAAAVGGDPLYYGGEDRTYRFTPTITGPYDIVLNTSTDDNSALMLYRGHPLTAGSTVVAVSQNSSGLTRTISPNLTAGITYYLLVDNQTAPSCITSYSLSITPPSCNPPTALVATATSTTAANISWTATAGAAISGYLWEIRTNNSGGGGAVVAASGTTASGVTEAVVTGLTANTTYTLYVGTNCTFGNSGWAASIPFTTLTSTAGTAVYCSNIIYYLTIPITSVSFGGMSHSSTDDLYDYPPYLENFTAYTGNVYTGTTTPIALKGNTRGANTYNFRIFIDWNHDGDFNDASEVYNGGSILNSTGIDAIQAVSNIAIPADASPGTTRIRIKMLFGNDNGSISNPCAGGDYGQTEDYTINVLNCTPTNWYVDNDSDTFGNPATIVLACESPGANYVQNGLDCNDNNTAMHQTFSFYTDADGDGYGFGTASLQCAVNAATPPTGYSINNTDCSPSNANIHPGHVEVLGNSVDDNCNSEVDEIVYCAAGGTDAYEFISNVTFNTINNSSPPNIPYENFTSISTSVDTGSVNNITITLGSPYAWDKSLVWIDFNKDGDFTDEGELVYTSQIGVGPYNGSITIPSSAPLGSTRMRIRLFDTQTSSNNTSCGSTPYGQVEDYTVNILQGCTQLPWYADTDNDGFGNPDVTISACTQPAGYVANNTDCNPTAMTYGDADGDGFGFGVAIACGIVTNDADCNDSTLTYADSDNDGFGAGAPTACGVSNNLDCNPSAMTYGDADGDGFGNAAGGLVPCGVANPIDCNDNQLQYFDGDGDGFGVGSPIPCGAANNSDCNDSDPGVHSPRSYYVDIDGDGFDVGSVQICLSSPPPGFSTATNGNDCNDDDADVWQTANLYLDADGDNYDAGQQSMCIGSNAPVGSNTTTLGFDCNDNDNSVWRNEMLYVDTDNDNYSDGLQSVCYGATVPQGFNTVSLGPDCNDNMANAWRMATVYIDSDNDNYNIGEQSICVGLDAPAGSNFTTLGIDCNDNDNSVWRSEVLYVDTDNDNYSNGLQSVCYGATIPQGFNMVSLGPDCNDNMANAWRMATVYIDSDNDNYNIGEQSICVGLDAPAGSNFTTLGFDCNDNDNSVWRSEVLYVDTDNDNYSNGLQSVCYGTVIPSGFAFTSLGPDCNDDDAAINPGATEICDGLDNNCNGQTDEGVLPICQNGGVVVNCGCDCPPGFSGANCEISSDNDGDGVPNTADCAPNDPTMYMAFAFYADSDADGYGFGNLTPVCAVNATTPPANYSMNNLDCNDSKNTIHPGVDEVGYNLIDDNCDGVTDEGFTPVVAVIQSALCNTILPAIDSQITANIISNAQGYRWKITTMNGPSAGQIQMLDTNLRVMKLTQLVNYAFNTQYKIDISVRYAGFWQAFTTSGCTVTTPAASTALTACGQTLSGMANVIFANLVPYATGYRFRISDPMNPSNLQTIERNVREFRMNLITSFQLQYGKQYNVAVSVKNTDGSWLPFGSVCAVTTPAFPTTSLQESQCSDYLVQTGNTQLYAIAYPGAIAYVFQLSGGGLSVPIEITKNTRTFKLNDFAAQLSAGATYNVKVRMVFDQTDLPGPFGKACTITIPAVSKQNAAAFDAVFNAVAYPNPFADSFNIDVTTASSESISVKVYDAIGRLLDTKQMKPAAEISNIGSHFPSGVYNLVVTQGDNVKTLRVVKR